MPDHLFLVVATSLGYRTGRTRPSRRCAPWSCASFPATAATALKLPGLRSAPPRSRTLELQKRNCLDFAYDSLRSKGSSSSRALNPVPSVVLLGSPSLSTAPTTGLTGRRPCDSRTGVPRLERPSAAPRLYRSCPGHDVPEHVAISATARQGETALYLEGGRPPMVSGCRNGTLS